jgi:predicted lipid carrier protein YhbT
VTLALLSPEWLKELTRLGSALPARPGATARIQVVVTGGPDGEVAYVQTVEDGRLVAAELGRDDSAEVTLTNTHADAVQIATGALDPSAAYMQGRTKVVGDVGRLMALMPMLQSEEHRALIRELAAATDL